MDCGNIKPIHHSSVHKICSGQVVLTLATAVKELVENSLDAGASIIEVKLKEYGSEQIEVIDNGKGVKASDFQSITLKHHTSKINDFSDVEIVSTFGFRGEALSSLCALSNVEIITCHKDSTVGSLLMYDHDGTLLKKTPTHRQVGTTVILKNLFSTLPVRHKEFLRNIRREYTKMIQLLTAYCLISVKKRITCINVTDKGKKSIVLSTNSCESLKDNISCLFSGKQTNTLMEFIQHSPSDSVLEEYFLPPSIIEKCEIFHLEGYISSSSHGEGRSSTDRQFFFINGRPCDLPKISKLINEVYHSFNKTQYPFVFLNINLTKGSADVNVTPDKRQIFVPEEKLLLCIVKTSLLKMYQIQPSQIKMSSNHFYQKKLDCEYTKEEQLCTVSEDIEKSLKRKIVSNISDTEEDSTHCLPIKSLRKSESCLESNIITEVPNETLDDIQSSPDSGFLSTKEASICTPNSILDVIKCNSLKKMKTEPNEVTNVNVTLTLPFNEEKAYKCGPHATSRNLSLKDILQKSYRVKGAIVNSALNKSKNHKQKGTSNDNIVNFFSKHSPKKATVSETNKKHQTSNSFGNLYRSSGDVYISDMNDFEKSEEIIEEHSLDKPQPRKKKTKTIKFDMEAIKKSLGMQRKVYSFM